MTRNIIYYKDPACTPELVEALRVKIMRKLYLDECLKKAIESEQRETRNFTHESLLNGLFAMIPLK